MRVGVISVFTDYHRRGRHHRGVLQPQIGPLVAALLPPELRAVAWSCRRPVAIEGGYRICGVCKPCRKRAEVSAQLNIEL